MARDIPLLQASYQDVTFTVLRCTDSSGRDWVEHRYPGRDLPELEDTGGTGLRLELTVVFVGVLWKKELLLLKGAIEGALVTAPAQLVHPVWGTLWGVARDLRVTYEDRRHDYAEASFTFQEGDVSLYTFAATTSTAAATSAATAAAAAARAAVAGLGG